MLALRAQTRTDAAEQRNPFVTPRSGGRESDTFSPCPPHWGAGVPAKARGLQRGDSGSKKGERSMNAAKRAALERAGFRIGDAKDFLGLSDEESAIVELRVRVAQSVRRLREIGHISQKQLAERMNSSQSTVAKIETASPGTSLDLLFRGFIAAGGKLDTGA
ncbi:MAG TPA: helix-turn-helix domain-containing protein, partial [Gemmataceae bacterium]|nr:helix-turn-helix domain-containing protein [Gemmataceae bacterium]